MSAEERIVFLDRAAMGGDDRITAAMNIAALAK